MDAVTLLLDPEAIAQIRVVEHAIGRNDLFSGLVAKLEGHLNGFDGAWSELMARGDTTAATRAAHTLKGTCRQLGAAALGTCLPISSAALRPATTPGRSASSKAARA